MKKRFVQGVGITAMQVLFFILMLFLLGNRSITYDLAYVVGFPSTLLGLTHSPRGGSYLADIERALGLPAVYFAMAVVNSFFWFVVLLIGHKLTKSLERTTGSDERFF
ncbi:MAG: hypothetical protein EXS18_02640 [Verrucomicrobiae bacterium]|nr:hypothetical protein [Verrucomicrobiae bacterium]